MRTGPSISLSRRNRNEAHRPIRLAELGARSQRHREMFKRAVWDMTTKPKNLFSILSAVGFPHAKLSDRSQERQFPHEAMLGDLLDDPDFLEGPKQGRGHEQAEAAGEKKY